MTYYSDAEIVAMARGMCGILSVPRWTVIAALLPLVGLEVGDPRYQNAIYPFDPPSQRVPLARRQSGCGLTTEVGWRAIKVASTDLWLPAGTRAVRGGRLYPVALERDLALRWGAARTPDPKSGALPLEGDAVVIGCAGCRGVWAKGTPNFEHEFTVAKTDYAPNGASNLLHSIDGGQPGIHCRTRALVWCGPREDELWAAAVEDDGSVRMDAADMRPVKGRRVLFWVDTDALQLEAA